MHSSLVRLQNVFGFFTTVAFVLAGLTAFSVLVQPQSPRAEIELRNVQVVKGRASYYSPKREEFAHIRFDADIDLTSLFTWNTKQLFVYIKATYPNPNPSLPRSEAIIWDSIIASPSAPWHENYWTSPSSPRSPRPGARSKSTPAGASTHVTPNPGKLLLQNQRPKYQITDVSGKLAGKTDVKLELGWNVQPWVGALLWRRTGGDWLNGWRRMRGGKTDEFTFPQVRLKDGDKVDLGTAKGGEKNRLMAG